MRKFNKKLTASLLVSTLALAPVMQVGAQTTHTVQSGEYLLKIANTYGVSVSDLKAWNGLSSDWIDQGQTLYISNPGTGTSTPTPTNPSKPQASAGVYIVQSGDTLWDIANANGVSYADLMAWNGLGSSWLNVGDQLVLNGSSSNATPAPTNTSTPSAPSVSQSSSGVHVVSSGDTLWDIANAYGVSYFDIMNFNGMSSDYLNVGDQIAIPGYAAAPIVQNNGGSTSSNENSGQSSEKPAQEETETSKETSKDTKEEKSEVKDLLKMSKEELEKYYETLPEAARPMKHKVTAEDTLESIATKYNFSQNSIRSWNELTDDTLPVDKEIYVSNPYYVPELHEVVEGDSVVSIAEQYDVKAENIDLWNKLEGGVPEVGTQIVVSEPAARQYTPKAGETLEDIAKKFGISKDELVKWNNLPETVQFFNGKLKVVDPEGVKFDEESEKSEGSESTDTAEETTVSVQDAATDTAEETSAE